MAAPNPSSGVSQASHKFIPSNPSAVMVIRDILPNLTTLSVPFLRFGRLRFGGRATIVRLQSGALAVFNPVALTPEAELKVTEKGGRVKYIAALDFEHHIFLGQWAQRWPEAEVIGMEGLHEKREKDEGTKGTAVFKHVFTKANKLTYRIGDEFDSEFAYEYVDAHKNKELVFFHKPTSTVIEADLIFNFPATEQYSRTPPTEQSKVHGPSASIFQRVFNAVQSTQPNSIIWQQRFIYHLAVRNDRPGMKESVKRMDSWGKVRRIVPAHGDVVEEEDAQRVWTTLFEWFRDGAAAAAAAAPGGEQGKGRA